KKLESLAIVSLEINTDFSELHLKEKKPKQKSTCPPPFPFPFGKIRWPEVSTVRSISNLNPGRFSLLGERLPFRSLPTGHQLENRIDSALSSGNVRIYLAANSASPLGRIPTVFENLRRKRAVAVVLLGNEKCDNDWILPYVRSQGGLVNVVFLVYDSPLVDNVQFYQWPLGVAVYRGFPNIKYHQVDTSSARSHVCNFLGTVYGNSSRETLIKIIKSVDYQDSCIILGRKKMAST
ncbi:hypothetical protein L9F63_022265, partial [Diploptera punctata]